MEAELAALAASGATTFVGLMATEAWSQVRGRLARFLARGDDSGAVDAELEESREELVAARRSGDEESAEDIAAAWRVRLRRALRDNPEAAGELRDLLDELAPHQATGPTVTVNNSTNGGTYYGQVIQAHDIAGLTFHGGGTAPRPEPEGR
ncbi:hypothetical protein [Streptomyces sp. YIM 132580]|uniref:hypothetical protein n=1 Tax=Streptomyces sp. YIM 132580 TaxID=2691958 RepID=UPI00136A62FF|nr:hypothetical protein [Streptomyces sp. YIM 132580]MXG28606.1 hypothetical protein [Streptomyces sp. YIM 132580]